MSRAGGHVEVVDTLPESNEGGWYAVKPVPESVVPVVVWVEDEPEVTE